MHYRPLNTMSKTPTNIIRRQRYQYYSRDIELRQKTITTRSNASAQTSSAPRMRSVNNLAWRETV